MSQVLSFTPKATKQTRWPVSEFVLQTATEDCCTMSVPNLLLPVYPLSLLNHYSQTGICESLVCVGWALKSNPLVPSDAPVSQKQQKQVESSLVAACLVSLLCHL